MIEIKNLNKIYRTKGAPDVHALVDVSIKFESTGMVFILGKSGSGKSTFLNVVGGLDSADSGEIIIKGKSSKDFSPSDFDSYRNTYLGFVFQEYNLIDEFTIGHNIGLALELQHKKATPEAIEAILAQVDMQGYADRMPTKISGGQKQRVAIARALIKEPQIIMADEPTGALDSTTGEQIFQTLKKLSKDKLVMVVSHDREYAEKYGDRIVEFKDGRIISDMVRTESGLVEQIHEIDGALVTENVIKIPAGTTLTDKHTQLIQEMLKRQGEIIISSSQELNKQFEDNFVKQSGQKKGKFVPTKEEMLNFNTDKTPFSLIKSRLPAKSASKMAKSSMKHKRGRLIFSIILSIFSIVFFGFASVMGGFKDATAVKSVINSYGYNHVKIAKTVFSKKSSLFSFYSDSNIEFSEKDIDKINDLTDGGIAKILNIYASLPFVSYELDPQLNRSYYEGEIYGIVCSDNLEKMGLSVPQAYGRFPEKPNEILISNYLAEQIKVFGLQYGPNSNQVLEAKDIKNINDMLNYTMILNVNGQILDLKIVGIINFDIERYAELKTISDNIPKTLIHEFNERKRFDISYIYGTESLYDLVSSFEFSQTDLTMALNLSEVDIESLKKQEGWQKVIIKPAKIDKLYNTQDTQAYLGADGSTNLPSLKKGEVILNLSEYFYALDFKTKQWEADNYDYNYDHNKLAELAQKLGVFNDDFRLNISFFISRIYQEYNQYYTVNNLNNLKVVGVLSAPMHSYEKFVVILSEEDYKEYQKHQNPANLFVYLKNNRVLSELANNYIGKQKAENKNFKYNYQYDLPFASTIQETATAFSLMSVIFFWISIAFCVFAALLLLNFISTSVAYKRKEIGVLRAIGAKRSDVVSIFLFEGLYIAIWILAFAIVIVFALVVMINNILSLKLAIPFSVMSLGILDIIYMCLLCLVTVALASILPVYKVSSLKPMDAIRGK